MRTFRAKGTITLDVTMLVKFHDDHIVEEFEDFDPNSDEITEDLKEMAVRAANNDFPAVENIYHDGSWERTITVTGPDCTIDTAWASAEFGEAEEVT